VVIHEPHLAIPVPLYALTKSTMTMVLQTMSTTIPAKEMQIVSFFPGHFVAQDAMSWDDCESFASFRFNISNGRPTANGGC